MKDKLIFGYPIEFQDICFVYPPTFKDIIMKGWNRYSELLNTLILSQEDLIDLFNQDNDMFDTPAPDPLTYLTTKCSMSPQYEDLVKQAFQFFTHQSIVVFYDSCELVVGDVMDKKIINQDNFFEFQNLIREICGITLAEKPDPNEHQHLRYLKAKSRKRERIKAKESGLHQDFTFQVMLACKSIGVVPKMLEDTPYAVGVEFIKLQQHQDKYQVDMMCICAGADSKQIKPQYWMLPTKD